MPYLSHGLDRESCRRKWFPSVLVLYLNILRSGQRFVSFLSPLNGRSSAARSRVYAYSPYGEATALGVDEGNPIQYTARENDQTGLYYYRARYYDPVLKRFISEDPIGLGGGLNTYSYVGGVPTGRVDPTGLWWPTEHIWMSALSGWQNGMSLKDAVNFGWDVAAV